MLKQSNTGERGKERKTVKHKKINLCNYKQWKEKIKKPNAWLLPKRDKLEVVLNLLGQITTEMY